LIRYSKATVMSDPQCCRISSAGALPNRLHQRIRGKHRCAIRRSHSRKRRDHGNAPCDHARAVGSGPVAAGINPASEPISNRGDCDLAGRYQECGFRLRSQTKQTKNLDRSISPHADSDACLLAKLRRTNGFAFSARYASTFFRK
jgi:hypothetical protein